MPRIINLYRLLFKSIDKSLYLTELVDYSEQHASIGVTAKDVYKVFKVEDLAQKNKKIAKNEISLKITDLKTKNSTSLSEADFLKDFPEFQL